MLAPPPSPTSATPPRKAMPLLRHKSSRTPSAPHFEAASRPLQAATESLQATSIAASSRFRTASKPLYVASNREQLQGVSKPHRSRLKAASSTQCRKITHRNRRPVI
eukprot:gene11033-biopygen4409